MIRKIYISSLILLLGLFLLPAVSFACEQKKQKSCCSRNAGAQQKKDCCKDHQQKSHKDCSGHCKHNSCECASSSRVSPVSFLIRVPEESAAHLFSPVFLKQQFHYQEASLSPGFCSIWLPPKIG